MRGFANSQATGRVDAQVVEQGHRSDARFPVELPLSILAVVLAHHGLTQGVCNISAAGAHGLIIPVGTVLRCLVFNLGIELAS